MHLSVLALAALAAETLAQTTTTDGSVSAQTTITALLGTAQGGFAGSVVSANACGTTIALACTVSSLCESAPTLTITQGPDTYVAAFATSTLGAAGSFTERCSLAGASGSSGATATQAVCEQLLSLSAPGTSTSLSTSTTLSGSALNYQPLPITAGADALSAATGSCTATGSSSKGAAAAAPTPHALLREVYKVVVPVGAAVMAGVLV